MASNSIDMQVFLFPSQYRFLNLLHFSQNPLIALTSFNLLILRRLQRAVISSFFVRRVRTISTDCTTPSIGFCPILYTWTLPATLRHLQLQYRFRHRVRPRFLFVSQRPILLEIVLS